jgi:hypothetical protein
MIRLTSHTLLHAWFVLKSTPWRPILSARVPGSSSLAANSMLTCELNALQLVSYDPWS